MDQTLRVSGPVFIPPPPKKKSYLSDRQQIVVVDGIKSNMSHLSAAIPRESKLGPILFIIYINDITEGLESDILIFTDDCSLLTSADDPAQCTSMLNRQFATK